jgi:hypothetical protein
MVQQFFYDNQIRRYLTQFIRLVSGFQVEFGQGATGQRALQQVPVIYGDQSRQAAQILKQNSENLLSSVPAIAVYISALDYDRERLQDPSFISKVNLRKREYDPTTGDYLNGPGDAYTVERMMPVPYKLTLKMDIWTSNTEQKLQLWEQISTLFNPSLEIQNTDNFIDWGSLTVVDLKSTIWDSRTVPAGADESISIATLQFELPIWLSSPAKVKRLGVVTKVINGIYDSTGNITEDIFTEADLLARRATTFRNYNLVYIGNQLKLISEVQKNEANIQAADVKDWLILTSSYGKIRNGISQVRLRHPDGISEVVGTVALHPTDHTILLYDPHVDTLPANNITAINAIIDPDAINVDSLHLLTPTLGTRYLITNPIGSYNNNESAVAWGANPDFVANANDIIAYTAGGWVVSYNSQAAQSYGFVTNLTTGIQYKFDYVNNEWVKSVEGLYLPDNWSIVI